MLKLFNRVIHRRIAAFERQYDYDMTYAHQMLDTSRPAFLRFSRVAEMAAHREAVPPAALFAAKLAATLAEDCGPCTQLVVKMAEEARVSPADLRAIIEGDEARMGDEARLGWRFAQAVLAHDAAADPLREQIVARWGKKARVSFALAIAAARMFPTVKYAMGHGRTCQRVRVGNVDVKPHAAHPPLAGAAAA
jgi:hypothetical protein